MELAMLTGHGPPGLVDLGGQAPLVEPADVVILGHRPAFLHPDVALELGRVPAPIARMAAEEVVAAGPAEVGEHWARALAARGPAWLHLDLDALDQAALPAVSYPQPRGLDWESFVALARPLLASDALVGASVADFNPDLDEDGAQARRIVNALASALRQPGSARRAAAAAVYTRSLGTTSGRADGSLTRPAAMDRSRPASASRDRLPTQKGVDE